MHPARRLLALVVATLGILLTLAGGCVYVGGALRAAPAPKGIARSPGVVGTWKMTWHGWAWTATFKEDGSYFCHHSDWRGGWSLRKGVLTVHESTDPEADDPKWLVWRVTLDKGKLTGKTCTGGSFALEPVPRKFD